MFERISSSYSINISIVFVSWLLMTLMLLFGGTAEPDDIDTTATVEHLQYREIQTLLKQFNSNALRRAIQDLTETFPVKFKRGTEFLRRLSEYEKQLSEIDQSLVQGNIGELDRIREFVDQLLNFQFEVLVSNPLVADQPILFVVRNQYKPDHHNTATIFQTGEVNTSSFQGGGALKTIDFSNDGKVKTLLTVHYGVLRDPEVYFDGKKIIFSMRYNIEDDYHIYEINTDGTGLKKLTSAAGVSDIDPLYLPDDSIIFSSTREPKFSISGRHIVTNLFHMEADGANIYKIGGSNLHESHGTLMPDGQILYDRWDHVDRKYESGQGLWTVNPDGTNHAVYWGRNTVSSGGVIDARIIPDTQQVLCIFCSSQDRPWGTLSIVDRRLGVDGKKSVIRTWPADAINHVGIEGGDTSIGIYPRYEDPYALSDKYFICSRMTGNDEEMGIYLIDIFGNEICLHVEGAGCYDPMPLKPHPRPVIIPPQRNFENSDGDLYVFDVYNGTHMEGVKRGLVKYLRVVESPEKRFWNYLPWYGQGMQCPAMNWHDFSNKRILGTVPVEEDGSAYFSVPSETFVYFQLLDENGMMIQSMRSGTVVQSGETRGCIGCHESRTSAPTLASKKMPAAVQREPSKLEGWHGEPRLFNYMKEVQHVFDESCVQCHDYGKDAGKVLNLAADRTNTFNTSYNELWRKKYIEAIGAGPFEIQQPYSWGSHTSILVEKILEGHNNIKLEKESFDRIVTWIDINAPYYPSYACAYPDNLAGRSPLDMNQIKHLSELTGVPFMELTNHEKNQGAQISFDRPVLSPCLAKLKGKDNSSYMEALAIIQEVQETLYKRPRADMDGFQACLIDQLRQRNYMMRQQVELRNREVIRKSGKSYDDR